MTDSAQFVQASPTRDWRGAALGRIAELEAFAGQVDTVSPNPDLVRPARLLLASARREVTSYGGAAWAATRAVQAVRAIDAAEVELCRVAPTGVLRSILPTAVDLVRDELPALDPRRMELERTITAVGAATAEAPPRAAVISALRAAGVERQRATRRLLRAHRRLLVAGVLLAAVAVAAAVAGAIWPALVPLCSYDGGSVQACPTGRAPGRADVAVVELLGAVGGALAAMLLLRMRPRGRIDPVSVGIAAALLKVPAGALAALGGVIVMQGRLVPGLGGLDTPAQILAWAFVFGPAQNIVTAPVDRYVLEVTERATRWLARAPAEPVPEPAGPAASRAEPQFPAPAQPGPAQPGPAPPGPAPPTGAPPAGASRSAGLERRLLSAGVAALASILGLLPVAVALRNWVPFVVAVLLVTVMTPLFPPDAEAEPEADEPPAGRRWSALLAGGGVAVAAGAAGGAVWLLVHLVVFWLVRLVNRLFDVHWPATGSATWVAAVIGIAATALATGGIVSETLSAALAARRHRIPIVMLAVQCGLAAVLLGTMALWPGAARSVAVGVLVVLFALAGGALDALELDQTSNAPARRGAGFSATVGQELERLGYRVTRRPKVGAPDVDLLLQPLNLIAERPHQALALQILATGPDGPPVGWRSLSELLAAAGALDQYNGEESGVRVVPVLVVVGRPPEESLRQLASDRSVELIAVEDAAGGLGGLRARLRELQELTPGAVPPQRAVTSSQAAVSAE